MKTSIRILVLALVVLLSMAVLAGCGGKAEEAAAPETQAAAPAAPEAPAAPAADGEVPPPPPGEPSGEPGSAEPPAEFVPLDPAGDYSRDWAGYQAYLLEACDGENAFPDDEMRQQVKGQIAAATEADYDVTVFPYEMLVGMHIAVSYEDFLAA